MENEKKTMTVLVVAPGEVPQAKGIATGLESLQSEVGGYIEAVYPFEEPVAIVCNEEGKLTGLPLNRALRDETGEVYDILAGTFLIVGLGEEDFTGLSEKQIKQFSEKFQYPEQFLRLNGRLLVLPIEPEPPKRESLLGKLKDYKAAAKAAQPHKESVKGKEASLE